MKLKQYLVGTTVAALVVAGLVGLSGEDLEGEVLWSNEFIEYEYDENGEVKSEKEMANYAYVSDEDAPALDNEIISKRTENIVVRDLGKDAEGNKLRSAESGHNFYKKDGEWKKVKFAKTEKKNLTSWVDEFIAWAADTGATSPGTMADDSAVGTEVWLNPDNAKASDNIYATVTTNSGISHYLKATNFGFSINGTIDGIVVEVDRKCSEASVDDYIVDLYSKIVKSDGSVGSENKADTGTKWPTTESTKTYGANNNLWSESWSDTDINDSDFGFVISGDGEYDEFEVIASVDNIRITVYYTASAPADTGAFFQFF